MRSAGASLAAWPELMRAFGLMRIMGAVVATAILGAACSSDPDGVAPTSPPEPTVARQLEFRDVAHEAGIDFRHGAFRWQAGRDPAAMMGGGVCWLDFDDDGWLDLYVVNSYAEREADRWKKAGGLPESALYRNVEGRFEDVSAASGANLAGRGSGCVAADLDLDGHTDLYVTTSRADSLFWNNGDGTFTEGASAAGVAAYDWRSGAAVGDVNDDGWPDLFVSGYASLNNPNEDATQGFPNTYFGVRDLLFLSEGPGDGGRVTFREVGVDAGLEVVKLEYGLGAVLSDVDRDGDLDLYLANDTNPNRFYENVAWPGGATADPARLGFRFEERAGAAGVADPNAGMGVAAGDYDGDGRPDLFVTNARSQAHAAYQSLPPDENEPSWIDVRAELGPSFSGSTGWGVTWADFDLDTDLDLLVANGHVPVTDLAADAEVLQAFGNQLAQGHPGSFADIGATTGLSGVDRRVYRGTAAADYDNDGDVDVAVATVGGRLVLLENEGTGANWLSVALEGFNPGAIVTVVLPDGRKLVRDALAGSSYLSSEDPRLHFGLGQATAVRRLIVRWPGGKETSLENVAANQLVVVEPPQ
jgi:hypothetical protein